MHLVEFWDDPSRVWALPSRPGSSGPLQPNRIPSTFIAALERAGPRRPSAHEDRCMLPSMPAKGICRSAARSEGKEGVSEVNRKNATRSPGSELAPSRPPIMGARCSGEGPGKTENEKEWRLDRIKHGAGHGRRRWSSSVDRQQRGSGFNYRVGTHSSSAGREGGKPCALQQAQISQQMHHRRLRHIALAVAALGSSSLTSAFLSSLVFRTGVGAAAC